MNLKTMGDTIAELRKQKGMTQKELADKLNITDKAVSKWERNIACPDTALIPKLAEILGVSIDELMAAKPIVSSGHRGAGYLMEISFPAIGLAMGVAVVVLSVLGELNTKDGMTMLGIGLACVSLQLINRKR
jgi:DNA-binding XRE family transcriptional regulator